MNAEKHITADWATKAKRMRVSPVRNLDATKVVRMLDAFEAGNLREAAMAWEQLEQRDDLLRTVISKRKKSVARHGWTVAIDPNAGELKEVAKEHAKALEYFYRSLECENALDSSEQGGFKLLARQMMDAVGKKFAVHEIVWKRAGSGSNRDFVSATFRFVPLGFFENTTGKLRFLENEMGLEGTDLEPGAWMVTTGDGLMAASSIGWVFKNSSLNDWLKYSEHHGTPGLRGVSGAARNSEEWKAMEEAVEDVLEGKGVVTGTTDGMEVINLAGSASIPFPGLVERIDRMLAALWRGADLSTISRDRGYGASLQEKETCALEEDDAEMLTETLNRYVDAWVIRYVFGEEVKPLANVKVLVTPKECTSADLQVDEFLLRHGAPLSVEGTLNRYGRTLPKAGEKIFLSSISSLSERNGIKASRSEGSHNLGMAEGMDNNHWGGRGVPVNSRGCSPAADTEITTKDTKSTKDGKELDFASGSSWCDSGLTLSNQFTLLQEDWVQLSPYGDFPHARGLQRVDRTAAEGMVSNFNSFLSRLGRLFGGVPFYVGHPDIATAHELCDRKAYGWVTELEARDDGLYGRVKWSDAGMELLKNAHYKFLSPFWEASEIGRENGQRVFRPVALVSVGLTNTPNIPVRPLANEADGFITEETKNMKREKEDELAAEDAREKEGLANGEFASKRADPTSSSSCSSWRNESRVLPEMHTVAITAGLGSRKPEVVRLQNRRDRIQEWVLGKMRLGLTYDQAWESVKREHRTWFEG